MRITTNSSQLELAPGVLADARRALWLEKEGALIVADLHLCYAWAHRQGGQLMPLSVREDTADRLVELQRDYSPRQIVLLGDIVHRAVAIPALQTALRDLVEQLSAGSDLIFVRGNHDRQLDFLMSRLSKQVELTDRIRLGPNTLIHGDDATGAGREGRIIIGHEHPAIWLDGGVGTGAKCPCFLASEKVIVLPAFSTWAAGCEIRRHDFMSSLARSTRFSLAAAIVGERLLPVPLQ